MVTASLQDTKRRHSGRALLEAVFTTRTTPLPTDLHSRGPHRTCVDLHLLRGGKLFGWFNGPGIHRTALYFSQTAHLHPGGFFAVLGGVIEFGSGIALAVGFASRLAGVALFGDMVMAMITVTWATGIEQFRGPAGVPVEPGTRCPGSGRCHSRFRQIQPRRSR